MRAMRVCVFGAGAVGGNIAVMLARAGADVLVSKDKALLKLRGRTRLPFQIVKPAAACALMTGQSPG